MARRKIRKVLFFIASSAATDAENEAIDGFGSGHNVCLRNASKVGDTDPIEDFDIVAGMVPPRYAEVAAGKGEDAVQPMPVVSVASVPAGSPVAPQEAPPPPPPPPEKALAGDKEAKPKPPVAKPATSSPWKPNA